MKKEKFICPICGYEGLETEPNASYEICPCCGYEFGTCDYDTGARFYSWINEDEKVYSEIRNIWLKNGAKWWKTEKKPKDWNLEKQLENLKKL